MAPARMMRFVDQHVKNCPVCAKDLFLPDEIKKIREFIFPESKIIPPVQTDDVDEERDEDQEEDEFATDGDDELEEDEEDDEI